jgi:hypothetical protein
MNFTANTEDFSKALKEAEDGHQQFIDKIRPQCGEQEDEYTQKVFGMNAAEFVAIACKCITDMERQGYTTEQATETFSEFMAYKEQQHRD